MRYSCTGYLVLALCVSSGPTCEGAEDPSRFIDAGSTPESTAMPVEIVARNGAYRLQRGGADYEIRGAGVDRGNLAALAAHGGTSIRTWSTNRADSLLDEAMRHGMTVMLCISIGRERHGFDYDDARAVAGQLEFARSEVLKYKDHPALLAWMIGNEPNLGFSNPRVFDAINDISRMIHEVDGNHPTTTALAGFDGGLAELIESRAPDLDFVSIQLYGGLIELPDRIREIGFTRPYMVTEWGAVGHWEVPQTAWEAPIEQNSSEKAANYLESYRIAIESNIQILGSYVFLWGQKQERTPTWYGMFLADGAKTEAVDVMHFIWNGEWPANRAPAIDSFVLDSRTAGENVTVSPGKRYLAQVAATDPDDDPLRYLWQVMRESEATQEGGDPEPFPEIVWNLPAAAARRNVEITAPAERGAYRLFVYAYDDHGNAAHANIPFLVD